VQGLDALRQVQTQCDLQKAMHGAVITFAQCCVLLITTATGYDNRNDKPASHGKCRRSVDCCVDLNNDNGIAVVVAAGPIPNDAKEAVMDPFDGENVAVDPIPNDAKEAVMNPLDEENASGQVKPRHEPYPLDHLVSSSADDIFLDYHDVSVDNDNDIFLDDHDGVVADDSITTEPVSRLRQTISSSVMMEPPTGSRAGLLDSVLVSLVLLMTLSSAMMESPIRCRASPLDSALVPLLRSPISSISAATLWMHLMGRICLVK
jgi:hypothetical protein